MFAGVGVSHGSAAASFKIYPLLPWAQCSHVMAAPTQGCVLLPWAHRALRCRAPRAASVISVICCTHAGRRGEEQCLIPLSQSTLNPSAAEISRPRCSSEHSSVLYAPCTPGLGSPLREADNVQRSLLWKLHVMNAQKQQNDEALPAGGAALPFCPPPVPLPNTGMALSRRARHMVFLHPTPTCPPAPGHPGSMCCPDTGWGGTPKWDLPTQISSWCPHPPMPRSGRGPVIQR